MVLGPIRLAGRPQEIANFDSDDNYPRHLLKPGNPKRQAHNETPAELAEARARREAAGRLVGKLPELLTGMTTQFYGSLGDLAKQQAQNQSLVQHQMDRYADESRIQRVQTRPVPERSRGYSAQKLQVYRDELKKTTLKDQKDADEARRRSIQIVRDLCQRADATRALDLQKKKEDQEMDVVFRYARQWDREIECERRRVRRERWTLPMWAFWHGFWDGFDRLARLGRNPEQ